VVNTSTTVPTGNIIFSDGATLLGTSVLNAQGIATLTVPSLGVGSHNISAAYGGDTLDLSSTSASVVETVQLRATSASLAASATSLNAGQQLTLFAAVQSTGPVSATGMVSFYSGSNLIGSTPLTGSGIATLTYSPTAGSYNITANYSGDSVYAQSSASAIGPIVVGGATQVTIALNPSSVSVVSQQYSIINVTLTAATNFTDTMQMGCAGLPTAATCTFSSDQVALSAAGTKTVQLTLDTGSPLTDGGQAKLEQHRATSTTMACALPAAILLGFLIFGARRNRRSIGGLLLLILAVGTISLTGCGTSVQMNGTPAGTYNVVVTAIGAKTGAMQSSTVVLTVTQ